MCFHTVHSADVQRYRDRISGPLLDRIDIHVEVPAVKYQDLAGDSTGEPSAAMRLLPLCQERSASRACALPRRAFRERIRRVREIQQARFAKTPKIRCNARMTSQQLKRFCPLDTSAEGMMEMAMNELNFSARAYDRILKVARTIADLAGSEPILGEHVGEAIQYRTLDRNLWA